MLFIDKVISYGSRQFPCVLQDPNKPTNLLFQMYKNGIRQGNVCKVKSVVFDDNRMRLHVNLIPETHSLEYTVYQNYYRVITEILILLKL